MSERSKVASRWIEANNNSYAAEDFIENLFQPLGLDPDCTQDVTKGLCSENREQVVLAIWWRQLLENRTY